MTGPAASPRIAVVGSLNADLTFAVGRLPAPGETVLAVAPAVIAPGGKGGNQAAAAAAFGGQVSMIGRVGDDDHGRLLLADLADRGIDVSTATIAPGLPTGTAVIAVDQAGGNLIIVDAGANGALGPADLAVPALPAAAAVLLQLEIPWPAVAAAARAARGLVILNPAPAPAGPMDPGVLALVDLLVPNGPELGLLAGVDEPRTPAEAARLAGKLALGADIVVTMGDVGAVAVPRAGTGAVHVPAPAAEVTDTTGAGDCFCGALAVGLSGGAGLVESVRLAVAAATISTTAAGARGRLPDQAAAAALAAAISPRSIDTG